MSLPTRVQDELPEDANEAIELCDKIIEMIDDDVPDYAKEKRAPEFFESVRQGVLEVQTTIQRTRTVTPKQMQALDNWRSGVKRWIR